MTLNFAKTRQFAQGQPADCRVPPCLSKSGSASALDPEGGFTPLEGSGFPEKIRFQEK